MTFWSQHFELMKRMYLATTTTIFEDGQLTCSGVSSTPLLMRFQVTEKLPVFAFEQETHEDAEL